MCLLGLLAEHKSVYILSFTWFTIKSLNIYFLLCLLIIFKSWVFVTGWLEISTLTFFVGSSLLLYLVIVSPQAWGSAVCDSVEVAGADDFAGVGGADESAEVVGVEDSADVYYEG